jgi:hypothetical protein
MKNFDVDVYVSQVIRFFETNPNELKLLIGGLNKDTFFSKVKEMSLKNSQNGDDPQLTRQQMIDIVLEMNKKFEIRDGFMITTFGEICLN